MSKILLALYTRAVAGNYRDAQCPNSDNQPSVEERAREFHERNSSPGLTVLNPWMARLPIRNTRKSESGSPVTNDQRIRNDA